jgi:hypothetical protein
LIIARGCPPKRTEWGFLWGGGGGAFLACMDLGITKDFFWFLNLSKTSSILYVVTIFSAVNPKSKQSLFSVLIATDSTAISYDLQIDAALGNQSAGLQTSSHNFSSRPSRDI